MANQGAMIWIYVLSNIVGMMAYLGLLIFVILRRQRDPSVNSLVVAGLLLLLAAQLMTRIAQPIMVRYIAASSIPFAFGLVSLAMTVASFCGVLCIVLAAVYRLPVSWEFQGDQESLRTPPRPSSDNPYDPPR